ncbi:MAG: hypothetical protein ACSHXW_17580 [Yoonia sp.]
MHVIGHNDVRIAEGVVRLHPSGASSFRRVRNNTFQLQAAFTAKSTNPIDVVRMALDSISGSPMIDIIIDDQLSTAEISVKTFGTGWTIFEKQNEIEITINNLFAKHSVALRIDSAIIEEAADLVREAGVEEGYIFYATPSCDFRFSVFCPLKNISCMNDILQQTQVDFCVKLPTFIDEQDQYLADVSTGQMNECTKNIEEVAGSCQYYPIRSSKRGDISPKKGVELQKGKVESDSVAQEHINIATINLPLELTEAPGLLNTENEQATTQMFANEVLPIQLDEIAKELHSKNLESDFDITFCILLDDKSDTAMAAAALLSRDYRNGPQIAEIGLWKRRFKSNFSRFAHVSAILELTNFPLSEIDYQDISKFLDNQMQNTSYAHPVVVLGQEMLDDLQSKDFTDFVGNQFRRIKLILAGQSELAISTRLIGVEHFVDIATECSMLIGGDALIDRSTQFFNITDVQRFYLPPYLKLSLLVAEKNGVAVEKIEEVSRQIISS